MDASVLNVGIDIGSTTIKVVVLNQAKEIIYKTYARHFSEIGRALHENLFALRAIVGQQRFSFALTGSAGMGVAQRVGLPFVQEVVACASAVRSLIPETDTAVELGGEDAKITYFGQAAEQRMNGICAGGTGSFIDHMAALLSTDAPGLNALAETGKQIYTIASRCGVFAKTDIQALINDGVTKADIALSIFQAVVNQTIGNLAQGRPIAGHIAFLGGPLYFLSALRKRFIETLKLTPEEIVPVQDGCYFVAMGAALSEERKILDFSLLSESMHHAQREAALETRSSTFVLFADQDEYAAFRDRHDRAKVPMGDLSAYRGPLYVGIDAGSTTTKLAVLGKEKQLLYTAYEKNGGSPLNSVIEELKVFYSRMQPGQYVAAAMTTGYGEGIVKAALHADGGEVETFAHLRAAQEFCPDVTFVLDIGGQDMKCFFVADGNIGNITLNEACSAGCGSFIQNFAEGLHMTPSSFAAKAIESKDPVDLGTRCTVFMNSRVKQAQKEGASVADISAGIALSVVKNALFKVMQLRDVSALGDHIVVQGGTFYNDAVLRALERLLRRDVIRPNIAGLMGAYGAALLAFEGKGTRSSLLSPDALSDFSVATKSYRCKGCGNQCLITASTFSDGSRYFTGNRCERGIGKARPQNKIPNIYEYKYARLFRYYRPLAHPSRGQIGIPRVLNMYEDYPFWFTFFTMLGYEVVLSGDTTAKTYFQGMATVPSDSLCYPAKLAHGHIMDLVRRGIKKIFYPCLPYNIPDEAHSSDNHYNCPVVASYAENIRGNMDILREKDITFLQPFLPIHHPKRLVERLVEELAGEHLARNAIEAAVEAAYIELQHYKEDVQKYGQKILERVEREHLTAILLAGRPYHVDPEINHGIPEMIQSYGLPVISEDMLCHEPVEEETLSIVNQWSYHARLYHAASYAAAHDNVTLIQFSSFGCGLDAITTGQVKAILEKHHRLYTMIKLDEVSNLGAARIRVRSLLAALARRKPLPYHSAEIEERPRFTEDCRRTYTILAPQMAPIHFRLLETTFRKHGYQLVIPDLPDQSAIDLGLRYIHNDMCYPAIVVIGQLLSVLESGQCDPDHTAIMLFQTCGACRATNYLNLMRTALKEARYEKVPVFACVGRESETDAFTMSQSCSADITKSIVYGDLLMRVKNRIKPYEKVPGSTEQLYETWLARCQEEIRNGNYFRYQSTIRELVKAFDELPMHEEMWKPKVGIVGEILVKYHPVANNQLENFLAAEGAEVVMPDLLNFMEYMAFDSIVKHRLLDGSYWDKLKADISISMMEFFRRPAIKALAKSRRFTPPANISALAKLAAQEVSLGNMAGEGWFLTGEMMELSESGIPNIVCLQPFGCLPNHITGKGVMHALRQRYPDSNIIALDCDAGTSEVNQANRLKLMLAVAKEKGAPSHATKAL
ncbi:MAG: acyl-CoA dehydratase activase-related protein [Schwartzia sp. (in: firmicutes)]